MRIRSVLGVVVAAVLVAPLAVSSAGASEAPDAVDVIEGIEPSILDGLARGDSSAVDDAVLWEGSGVSVSLPQLASDEISLTTGGSVIGIGLPASGNASVADVHPEGAVSYSNEDATTTVATIRESGSVQITTVIEDASAPTEYSYPVSLPEGATLTAREDGSVAVFDATGELVAIADVPWAKDATGAAVPTYFTISGGGSLRCIW